MPKCAVGADGVSTQPSKSSWRTVPTVLAPPAFLLETLSALHLSGQPSSQVLPQPCGDWSQGGGHPGAAVPELPPRGRAPTWADAGRSKSRGGRARERVLGAWTQPRAVLLDSARPARSFSVGTHLKTPRPPSRGRPGQLSKPRPAGGACGDERSSSLRLRARLPQPRQHPQEAGTSDPRCRSNGVVLHLKMLAFELMGFSQRILHNNTSVLPALERLWAGTQEGTGVRLKAGHPPLDSVQGRKSEGERRVVCFPPLW